MSIFRSILTGAVCLIAMSPAIAQLPGGLSTGSATSALGGLGGGGLPNLSSTTAGNAAGVLSYCVKNKIIGGSSATSTLSTLTGKSDVTSSEGFAAGQSGNLVAGEGKSVALPSVAGPVKSKLCNLVLQHAQSFL
jgi:hypothetical protein